MAGSLDIRTESIGRHYRHRASDPEGVAKSFGINVVYTRLPHDRSGYLEFDGYGGATIYVRSEDTPSRQKFTIAHELGHYVLEHDAQNRSVLRDSEKNLLEQEADAFANELLIPKRQLIMFIEMHGESSLDSPMFIHNLAYEFLVSSEVARRRVEAYKRLRGEVSDEQINTDSRLERGQLLTLQDLLRHDAQVETQRADILKEMNGQFLLDI